MDVDVRGDDDSWFDNWLADQKKAPWSISIEIEIKGSSEVEHVGELWEGSLEEGIELSHRRGTTRKGAMTFYMKSLNRRIEQLENAQRGKVDKPLRFGVATPLPRSQSMEEWRETQELLSGPPEERERSKGNPEILWI